VEVRLLLCLAGENVPVSDFQRKSIPDPERMVDLIAIGRSQILSKCFCESVVKLLFG
jgi:hypothetical protein